MGGSLCVTAVLAASPEHVYRAWLDGRAHGQMTGSPAKASRRIGGRFSAWDGYIKGRNLALEPAGRIVQSWRTSDFPEGAPDSQVEVLFKPAGGGTRITIRHSCIPAGQVGEYRSGWLEYYLRPMRRFFASHRAALRRRSRARSDRRLSG